MNADEAYDELVRVLELEPMGDRPDGKATWEDVVYYTMKARSSLAMTNRSVARRSKQLAAALGMPEDTPWPELVRAVNYIPPNSATSST